MTAPAGPRTADQGHQPNLRWSSRAHSIAEIESELGKIWHQPDLTPDNDGDGVSDRLIAARTSVMNLVVLTRRPELGEHCAAIISMLTGRHPSRTVVVNSADPDGPSWLDARVQALCMLPREGTAETCAEFIYLTAGGESGRHLHSIVAPLLIHDLPVTIWWPGDPAFGAEATEDIVALADRLVVDGSTWSGDGLVRLARMAAIVAASRRLVVTDFALTRQSRWREAIASVFDLDDFRPYLRRIRRIAVTYATHDESGAPGTANVVKPVYHVAWLASRLGMEVVRPLEPVAVRPSTSARPSSVRSAARLRGQAGPRPASLGLAATLHGHGGEVAVVIRPVVSEDPAGTTLRVELLADYRRSELRVDVTAEAESVLVHVFQDGVEVLGRAFHAPRRTEVDLLAEAIEGVGPDPVGSDALQMAAVISRPAESGGG